jgi:hypothetical protein
MSDFSQAPRTVARKSAPFDDYTLSEIRRAALTGIYDIRGGGAKRKLPHFDDLLFSRTMTEVIALSGLSVTVINASTVARSSAAHLLPHPAHRQRSRSARNRAASADHR